MKREARPGDEATGTRTDMQWVAGLDRRFYRDVTRIAGNGLLVDLHEQLGAAVSEVIAGLDVNRHVPDYLADLHGRLVNSVSKHNETAARLAAFDIVDAVRRDDRDAQ